MLQGNWKSRTLLISVVFIAGGLLLLSLVSLTALPLMGWTGFLPLAVMLLMTFGAGRLTVPIMKADGHSQSQKSVAETLIFLATMMYAVAPASTIAPAVILAAFVGYISSSQSSDRRGTIFTTCAAIISTCAAAFLYSLLVHLLASSSNPENGLPFGTLLLPLCVLALVQYFLSTLGTAAFMAFESGDARLSLHRDTLVWTSVTQVGSAASAALFYTALHGGGLPFIFVGFLIIGLVYMLYRFDEQRVLEAQRAEVEKMRHIQEIADLHMNTIESLAIAIDAKDQTTHGHVRRTQIYATEMGKVLNVSEAELQALLAGALLHDIGKLAVPEYILNKPGKLTESEFAKMKIHPTVGGDILKRVNFPYPVEDIVRYHHEKWDGTGYPKGLKANSIPLVARIISVIDFYDATRCDRPYRKGMKREESLALLKQMSGSSFDPHIVERFTQHIIEFDTLIAAHDIQEQVSAGDVHDQTNARPDAGLSNGVLGAPDEDLGFRSITEAQREVFALHEIAQTIGSSLNLQDTVALVSNKLRAIVPFDTCIIFLVDEKTGKAVPVHVAGDNTEVFARRRMNIGEGVTGWVIANGRSMCNASPELDLVGVPEEISSKIRGVVVSPLIREDGAFGAITLYSNNRSPYTTENVRLLESVSQHAASALNNAMTFEKTKESALTDQLTDLPNARAFYMMLEQRIAECQRLNRESLAVICMDVDDFKKVNDQFGHTVGDRVLTNIAGVIKKELRQMDILTRYAGDEFVAIMPMASTLMAGMVAERIRSAVQSQKFEVRAGKFIEINVSMGISCFPADGETTEHLLTSAARNMQQDKHARKTIVTLSASPNANSYDLFT
jgi:diguanylate cyclase (GGDEF)-like protein/putative nucleotidyltransferase with HDIG domain